MPDPVVVSTLARSAEAVSTAQKIKDKVQSDNAEGWYHPVKVEPTVLRSTPEYLQKGLKMLKKNFGLEMAAFLVGLNEATIKTFTKWTTGKQEPSQFQAHKIRSAIEVAEILLATRTAEEAKAWLISPCAYLDPLLLTTPMDEIRADPEAVRKAALYLFS